MFSIHIKKINLTIKHTKLTVNSTKKKAQKKTDEIVKINK